MINSRKVDNLNPMRHKVLKYFWKHPKELQYITGDSLAKYPETIRNIIRKHRLRKKSKRGGK